MSEPPEEPQLLSTPASPSQNIPRRTKPLISVAGGTEWILPNKDPNRGSIWMVKEHPHIPKDPGLVPQQIFVILQDICRENQKDLYKWETGQEIPLNSENEQKKKGNSLRVQRSIVYSFFHIQVIFFSAKVI